MLEYSPGTSTRERLVPASHDGASLPPVTQYEGPPPSRRSTFRAEFSLRRLAMITPAGPDPTTITSYAVTAEVAGGIGVAKVCTANNVYSSKENSVVAMAEN